MNTHHYLAIFIIFLFTGCSVFDECDELGENLGTLKLSSRSSFPSHYDTLSEVRFLNASNQVMTYAVSTSEGHHLELVDQSGTCGGRAVHDYYEVESLYATLSGPKYDIDIVMDIDATFGYQSEYMEISLTKDHRIQNRLTLSPPYYAPGYYTSYHYDTLYNQITIRGRDFRYVYESVKENDITIMYGMEDGLVAIKEGDELWLVEE